MPQKPDNNLLGQKIEPTDNPGTWIGKRMRAKIAMALTCLLNGKFTIPVDSGDGLPVPTDATVTMGPNGFTVLFPALRSAAGLYKGSSGGGTVPFSGNGAPSATTLPAGNYIAGPSPLVASLYVDLAAKVLYVCTTVGTASTSVWSATGSAPGNFAGAWDNSTAYAKNTLVTYPLDGEVNQYTGIPIPNGALGLFYQNGTGGGGSPITGVIPLNSSQWTFICYNYTQTSAGAHIANPGFLWGGNYNSAKQYFPGAAVLFTDGKVYYNPNGDAAGIAPGSGNWVNLSGTS